MVTTTRMTRLVKCLFLVFLCAFGASGAPAQSTVGGAPAGRLRGAITIEQQGSFFVGGKTIRTETGNDGTAQSTQNPGSATIDQMYVQFQIPSERRYPLPIVMMHGGGHHGTVYDATPDGREGWRTYFLRQGFAVYVADSVNRGRSGYDITDINLVKQGAKPVKEIPAINRYSHERAWIQFRLGPSFGTPNPGSQFPKEAFDQYTAQLVPAWRDEIETSKNVAALVALLDRIGSAIVLTWSQSGIFGWLGAVQRPEQVKAIVALEPAGVSPEGVAAGLSPENLKKLAGIPILLEVGDFDPPRVTSLRKFAASIGNRATVMVLPEEGIRGNSHLVMLEKNNIEVADRVIRRLERMIPTLPQ